MPKKSYLSIHDLVEDAEIDTRYRKHHIEWGHTFYARGSVRIVGSCLSCRKKVYCTENPQPNEAHIAGEAVALMCDE
jgi:hypothetical protein